MVTRDPDRTRTPVRWVRSPRRTGARTPDHPLVPEPDGTVADWWLEQLLPWGVEEGVPVASLVPRTFEAVCQVLHPWSPGSDWRGASWREIARRHGYGSVQELDRTRTRPDFLLPLTEQIGSQPSEGELDQETAEVLVESLRDATNSSDDVFVAVWQGWDGMPERFPGAARVPTLKRGHFLLRGPLHGVLRSDAVSWARRPVPGLWWPADRAWFVATEIDFQWTFVAGSPELIETLIADERLEVARTRFDDAANRAYEPDIAPPGE